MKLLGSNRYGVMAVNNVSFDSGLRLGALLFVMMPELKMCHAAWH
jgi:hypothetical protein